MKNEKKLDRKVNIMVNGKALGEKRNCEHQDSKENRSVLGS